MASVPYKRILEDYRKHPAEADRALNECVKEKVYTADDFSFKALAYETVGKGIVEACAGDKRNLFTVALQEHAGAVSTAAFKDIAGQFVFSMMLPEYTSEEFVFTKIIPERQSEFTFEKAIGLSGIGPGTDSEWVVPEGEPYNYAGFGPNFINLPETVKRGKIVPVTREAIFFDRTNKVRDYAKSIGYWLGYNREIRAIDCIIDENAGAKSAAMGGHRYHWLGNSIATYGDNSGTHSWDNLVASNALVDWTDIDAIEQVMNTLVDPFTGAPIATTPTTIITTRELKQTVGRILTASQLHVLTPGYATSGNPTVNIQNNPYSGAVRHLWSALLAQRMATDTTYYYGTPEKAFIYVVNFPFQQQTAPPNSDDEFERDIVLKCRADERGAYGTIEPRHMVKSTAA
jgi:hypothetical protein